MADFTKPVLKKSKLKCALIGPSWSGKTYSALRLARGLVGPAGRIAVIDTENNSAAFYTSLTDFDHLSIEPEFKYQKFQDAIELAIIGKYDCLIIDSASHIWEGALALKEKLDRSDTGKNSFVNWSRAGAGYTSVLNAIIAAPLHVIACMRTKTEYVIERDEAGKTTVKKVGLAPVMRDGSEYEFSVVLSLNAEHTARAEKDRTKTLPTNDEFLIDENTGETLKKWIEGGLDKPKPINAITRLDNLETRLVNAGVSVRGFREYVLKKYNVSGPELLSEPHWIEIESMVTRKEKGI